MGCAGYDEVMPSLLDNLDVFYGELTPARAMVYARLEGLANGRVIVRNLSTVRSLNVPTCGPSPVSEVISI